MSKDTDNRGLHEKILELLQNNPQGLTIQEMRKELGVVETQEHFNRRVRDLRKKHRVPLVREGGRSLYVYEGPRLDPVADDGVISGRLRAAVLNKAHGRCQMCGRTVEEDGIKLQVDHKIPQNWGGATEIDNLWALCQPCNGGKRDFFASMDREKMTKIVALESVYERIAETLRLYADEGQPAPSWLLEFVANANDYQDDWRKRLRELRYPVVGLSIKATRRKLPSGKVESAYLLQNYLPWEGLPPNHKFLIKEYENRNK